MGQTLEKPAVEKRYSSGVANEMKFAMCGMQGWRLDMEDAHSALGSIGEKFADVSYFAVFDGHAGAYTSNVASEELHKHIVSVLTKEGVNEIPAEVDTPEMDRFCELLSEAFISFDDMLKESEPYKSLREACGSTALVMLVTSKFIIFCNCGDSRGFLARSNAIFFETKDHKPNDTTERTRIESSGGCVVMDRVNGNLAVSRALGDFSFKERTDLPTRQQAVSPEPTVTAIPRDPDIDQFVLLACDGIWDVMTCEDVRNFVHNKLLVTDNYEEICCDLIDHCLIKDSRDNMTALLVCFPAAPQLDGKEKSLDAEYCKSIEDKVREISTTYESTPSLITILNALAEYDLLPDCASKKLGVYAKSQFVESILNSIDPKRDTSRDYSSAIGVSSFPISLQAFQKIARGDQGTDAFVDVPSSPTCYEDEDMDITKKMTHGS